MPERPSVLFVCVHNAGRSQMAAAWLQRLSGGSVEVRSAGSAPAGGVNPAAVAAMLEVGVDITAEVPKLLTTDAVRPIRDAIRARVVELLESLGIPPATS